MTSEDINQEHKKWIDNASYEDLLIINRFEDVGHDIFQGDTGNYFMKVMSQKRTEVGNAAHVATSKRIGWGKS